MGFSAHSESIVAVVPQLHSGELQVTVGGTRVRGILVKAFYSNGIIARAHEAVVPLTILAGVNVDTVNRSISGGNDIGIGHLQPGAIAKQC